MCFCLKLKKAQVKHLSCDTASTTMGFALFSILTKGKDFQIKN